MCGFLISLLPSSLKHIHKKHLIKWAAIYTIVTHKFPKVFKDHEHELIEAPRRLIKTAEDIEKMRVAGRLAAEVLEMIKATY